jgi:hypothetical protein
MDNMRNAALHALARTITCAVPELIDKVCVGAPPSSHEQAYPSMTVNAIRWRFIASEIEEIEEAAGAPPGLSIRRIGSHEAMIQIRILCTSTAQRDELAEKVVQVFLDSEDEDEWPHPGIIIARITDCGFVPWTASFELDQDEWVNLRAFDRQYEALIEATGILPAFSCKPGVPTIDTLEMGVTDDFTATPSVDNMAPPVVELAVILQDGTVVSTTPL